MVDLPTINNVVPVVRAPESRIPSISIRSSLRDVADAVDTGAHEANTIAKEMAKEAGLKSVTRDEDGNVQVAKYPIVGDAALAFKSAVQTAAIADGETQAKKDLVDIQQQFKDDPEGFKNAAASYRKTKVSQYEKAAGAAVGLSLGRAIDNSAIEFYRGALNRKENLELHNAASSINTQIETTKNELFALKNGGAADDAPEVQSRLQKVGGLWGQLANNPRMGVTPDRVAFEISKLGSELTVAGLDHHIQNVQKEKGVEAAIAEANTVETDLKYNLSPGQRINYKSRLIGRIQERVDAQKAVDKGTAGEITAIGKIAAEGGSVSPERLANVQRIVAESKNPALEATLRQVEWITPIIQDWRKQSPAQLDRNLSDLNATMRTNASEELVALRDIGTKLLKNMRDGIKDDPLGWSDRTGGMPVPALDFSKPDIDVQMRNRANIAENIAGKYGIAPSYLRPDERVAIQKATAQGGNAMTGVAAAIVQGFGDRAPRVLSELGDEAPVLGHIGNLINANGSQSLIRDAADAVALRQNKEFKHPTWFEKESNAIYMAQNERATAEYGNAFFLMRDTGRAAIETANAAFYTRSARENYDPKFVLGDPSLARKAYNTTLQQAAGATYDTNKVQYGGIGSYGTKPGTWFQGNKVLVPPNIRTDRFGDVIGAIRDEDVAGAVDAAGKPYTAANIKGAIPVWTKGGYNFAQGDPLSDSPKWIRGADGRPFVLDIEAMEPVLRRRVRGAYIGQ